VSQSRPFGDTDTPSARRDLPVSGWRTTEPMAKFSGEISIIAKTARVGDLADRLTCGQQRPAVQKVRGVIQTKRMYEFTASRAALGKELLQVTQRDPRFGGYLNWTKIRIGKALLADAADTGEQLIRMVRDGPWIGRRK
jgi:hypothetical protein